MLTSALRESLTMKKKTFSLFISLFFFKFSFAQNLVPNPSFEDTVGCPHGLANMQDAVGWAAYRYTPDYFNPCNYSCSSCNNGQAAVPSNICGYQEPRTGDAYAGFGTYVNGASLREWMGAQLTDSLIIGKRYNVEFFVSMAFTTAPGFDYFVGATNKMGARFSTVPYSPVGNNLPLNGYCQVYTDSVIDDTSNWVSISGSFIADSAYKYIVIGNFFSDSAITQIPLDTAAGRFPYSYYYVEDVSVKFDTIDSVNDIDVDRTIKVFPNPARDWIVLEGRGIKSVEILNALGSNLGFYPMTASTLRHSINVSSFSQGIYFLKVNMIDEHNTTLKIILQN
jgi:hypothetical protein